MQCFGPIDMARVALFMGIGRVGNDPSQVHLPDNHQQVTQFADFHFLKTIAPGLFKYTA
jgi:hypothetical protein